MLRDLIPGRQGTEKSYRLKQNIALRHEKPVLYRVTSHVQMKVRAAKPGLRLATLARLAKRAAATRFPGADYKLDR
eukprot:scaffold77534_cov46-Prasinocladus_malaysianus.AAC.1